MSWASCAGMRILPTALHRAPAPDYPLCAGDCSDCSDDSDNNKHNNNNTHTHTHTTNPVGTNTPASPQLQG
jgi:hypothetical protein